VRTLGPTCAGTGTAFVTHARGAHQDDRADLTAPAYAGAVGEFTRKLRAYRRVFRRAGAAGAPDLAAVLRRRPPVLLGVAAYELSVVASGHVDTRLKTLAALKASSRIGCPF